MESGFGADRAGTVRLGDRVVRRIGLGTNRLTDTASAHAVVRRAVELGVNLFDTADVYQGGESEKALGSALAGSPSGVLVATKGGMVRTGSGMGADGRAEYLRRAVEASCRRLRTDCLELYQLHRVDPAVPIETSVGTLRELQEAGRIRQIGVSNVTVEELDRARRAAPIVSVQNRYNVLERVQEPVLEYCEAHSIVFVPWTPLVRGKLAEDPILAEAARRYAATPHQVALRWLLMRSPAIVPIPGTLSPAHLEENLAAASVPLSADDFHRLGAARESD